jgi:hypothetical protein
MPAGVVEMLESVDRDHDISLNIRGPREFAASPKRNRFQLFPASRGYRSCTSSPMTRFAPAMRRFDQLMVLNCQPKSITVLLSVCRANSSPNTAWSE